MDNFKVLCLVGEGSFGRVFKAKRRDNKEIVALKIIRKCGRTPRELLSLRSECQIQKHLHHPNIIQMINSFETDNEIVVVTEFCKRDLHYILSKQTYLPEETALPIVCDLVSALYYLHSNRVLHRDLKPQNVLMDKDGVAKLCDFGFARTMSRGTHVLTSIKGTPLYMAPELIEESPYDHNADLWSLGCIVYEMVSGMPPFTTTSILQLVRMIRYEPITWPTYLSSACRDFLEGLLRKDPSCRLTWPLLLQHPFLEHRVSSSLASEASLPLTKELTLSQAFAKECQKQDLANKVDQYQNTPQKIQQILDSEKKILADGEHHTEGGAIDLETLEQKLSCLKAGQWSRPHTPPANQDRSSQTSDEDSGRATTPLETEEWLAFLQQSMKEVMRGDVESMSEKSFITMVTNALTNHGSVAKVSEYIAILLSLPYVAPGVTQSELASINSVYKEVKLVSSLVFGLKLVASVQECSQLSGEQLTAVKKLLVLVNQLIHSDIVFLSQLCDVVALLHLPALFHLLLSYHRTQPRIATDVVAILSHILRMMPENTSIVNDCLVSSGVDWYRVMKYGNKILQKRVCTMIPLLAQHCPNTLQAMGSKKLQKYIQILAYDSSHELRSAAEGAVEVVQDMSFFNKIDAEESS